MPKPKKQIEHLCFTVTGEFLTHHARSLWEEGSPKEAINFLIVSLPGMKVDMALDICTGYKAVMGDTKTNPDLWVDKDNTKKPGIAEILEYNYKRYFDNMEYIDIVRNNLPKWENQDKELLNYQIDYRTKDNLKIFTQIEFIYGLLDKPINEFYSLLDEIIIIYRKKITEEQRLQLRNELIAQYPTEKAVDLVSRFNITEIQERNIDEYIEDIEDKITTSSKSFGSFSSSDLEAGIAKYDFLNKYIKQKTQKKKPTKKNLLSDIKDTKWEAGWVSPKGEFFGCSWMGHLDLVYDLSISGVIDKDWNEKNLEEHGWIKLMGRGIRSEPGFYLSSASKYNITQSQQNAIFDFMTARKLNKFKYNFDLLSMKEMFDVFEEGGR